MTSVAAGPVVPVRSAIQGTTVTLSEAKDLRLSERILRVPLLGKLLGANLLIVAAAVAAHYVVPFSSTAVELALALALSFAVTGVLTWLALRPIMELEATADRVSHGDFAARVPASILADRDIQALSLTMNRLLDRVSADRARIQYLAGRSVRARDIERASVARELRDSLAQLVSAAGMQLAVAQASNTDASVARPLDATRALITQLGDEMRSIAETLHPGTLGELGLANALSALTRRASRQSMTQVQLDTRHFYGQLPLPAASALYRAAEEAVRNVIQHADAANVRVILRSGESEAVLEIEDDGRGMDLRSIDPLQAGLGLFSARAVLALAGGDLQISSAPGRGTRVLARVPLNQETTQP